MYLLISLRKYHIKVALIYSRLNKSVLPLRFRLMEGQTGGFGIFRQKERLYHTGRDGGGVQTGLITPAAHRPGARLRGKPGVVPFEERRSPYRNQQ
jgi:hypothetical protein